MKSERVTLLTTPEFKMFLTSQARQDAVRLADDVRRNGESLKAIARELREHSRRLTRLEAKWEAAIEITAARAGGRQLHGGS